MDVRRKVLFGMVLVSAIGVVLFFRTSNETYEAVVSNPLSKTVAPIPSLTPSSQATSAVAAPLEEALPVLLDSSVKDGPTMERLRSEVASNPHATPLALLEFASRMSKFMSIALKSPEAAQNAALQLEQCVSADPREWADSVRALCLANFERLTEANPDQAGLHDRFLAAQRGADPRVTQIVRAMNKFGQ